FLCDTDKEKAAAVAERCGGEVTCAREIAKNCDFIFMAVKPNVIKNAAAEIKDILAERSGYTVVSMAAGVSLSSLAEALGESTPIIRIMPNTPTAVGSGMTLYAENGHVGNDALSKFEAIMEQSGELDRIPERLIDAGSAVSGCGPAFVYMFIEALSDGGVAVGLPRDKATLYAANTLIGAAKTLICTGEHPEKLKDAVCSPGGSTIEGVRALEEGAFRAAAASAVVKAYEKTLILGK
ncbi:MAG: pyrroline-5-carboxylate reductase, partial [Clostridia bacterium]|nr:pyrroline-5-carboxylate reductase [Clostridia bacterium]